MTVEEWDKLSEREKSLRLTAHERARAMGITDDTMLSSALIVEAEAYRLHHQQEKTDEDQC